jgi:hypothetical protein
VIQELAAIEGQGNAQEIAQPKPGIVLKKTLLKTVSVLEGNASGGLSGDELLVDAMLVKMGLGIGIAQVRFTVNEAVSEQKIVVIFTQVVPDPRPEKQLFGISDRIEIPVLNLVVPIPFVRNLFVAKVNHPVSYLTCLRQQGNR